MNSKFVDEYNSIVNNSKDNTFALTHLEAKQFILSIYKDKFLAAELGRVENSLTYIIQLQDFDNTGMIDESKMLNLIESLSCDFTKQQSIEIKKKIRQAIADKIKSKLGFLKLNFDLSKKDNNNVNSKSGDDIFSGKTNMDSSQDIEVNVLNDNTYDGKNKKLNDKDRSLKYETSDEII